jgi:two-component system response regulator PilR (NtrC family)
VLLVDYSSAMRSATSTYLNAAGVHVVEAANMTLAQQILNSKDARIDALITDLELPDGGGVELISSARRERPDLPCIVWTMHEGVGVFDAATLAGARHCINKLAREELVTELERAGILQARRSSDPHSEPVDHVKNRSAA